MKVATSSMQPSLNSSPEDRPQEAEMGGSLSKQGTRSKQDWHSRLSPVEASTEGGSVCASVGRVYKDDANI